MENNFSNCSNCGETKDVSMFYTNGWCISCNSKASQEYRKTRKGLPVKIYSTQRTNSRKRGDAMPSYTGKELKEWLYSQEKYHILYDNWKRGGLKKNDKPSVDRIDDYKPYTLDNLQLMTWLENKTKYYKDVKSGINIKATINVLQFNKQKELIKEYYSIAQASRDTGVHNVSISQCFSGKAITAGGFIWRKKETVSNNN